MPSALMAEGECVAIEDAADTEGGRRMILEKNYKYLTGEFDNRSEFN
jgi:hypothetical protein